MEYQIWDGDLFLYSVQTQDEANEAWEAGFTVVADPQQEEEIYSPYLGM